MKNRCYTVSAYIKDTRKREDIGKPDLTLQQARRLKKDIQKDLKLAIPKYKWAKNLKIKRGKC